MTNPRTRFVAALSGSYFSEREAESALKQVDKAGLAIVDIVDDEGIAMVPRAELERLRLAEKVAETSSRNGNISTEFYEAMSAYRAAKEGK